MKCFFRVHVVDVVQEDQQGNQEQRWEHVLELISPESS